MKTRTFTDALATCCAADVYPLLALIQGAYGIEYDKSRKEITVNLVLIREDLNHLPETKSYEFVDGDSCGAFEIRCTVFHLDSPFPEIEDI